MNQLKDMGEAMWYSFTQALSAFMSFLPALLGALVVLIVGWLIAGGLARLVERGLRAIGLEQAVERSGIGHFIEQSGARWTVSGIIAAFNELGIAETVVNTLLVGLIGALALALGLAFGLGGREVAARITQSWYEKGSDMAGRIRQRSERFQPGDVAPAGIPPRSFEPGRPGPFEPRMGD
jgi:hypothetical protein